MADKPTDDQLRLLRTTVEKVQDFSDKDWTRFASDWKVYQAAKKKRITEANQKEDYLYFVIDGVQRIYQLSEEGKETTLVFSYTPSFSGVLDAFLLNLPSSYYFETITDSVFLRIEQTSFQKLIKDVPSIAHFVQTSLALSIQGLLHRLAEMQSCKAEEKFKLFMKRSPHMLHIVPQKYLADYLGIDPTNFSKFINKIKI